MSKYAVGYRWNGKPRSGEEGFGSMTVKCRKMDKEAYQALGDSLVERDDRVGSVVILSIFKLEE